MNMTNWVLNVEHFRFFKRTSFLNTRYYSDSTVRVRFAPSPTGKGITIITIARLVTKVLMVFVVKTM